MKNPSTPAEPKESEPLLIDLALQGGGSHGAFTWGVLDRLLDEKGFRIDGISGTSAGAMNAAVLVDGFSKGGAAGAQTALEAFWRRVSEARWAGMRVHLVGNAIMNSLTASSKLIAEWDFLTFLRNKGRKSAESFLELHGGDLGRKSTVDLDVLLERA
jgi:predicted acylesterase/phospholipase RssA